MKKYILIALLSAMSEIGQAQQNTELPNPTSHQISEKTPEQRLEQRTKRMAKRYGMDVDQSAKLLEINRLNQSRREAQRQQKEADHAAYLNSLRQVMSDEQYAAYEKDALARKNKRKSNGPKHKGHRP